MRLILGGINGHRLRFITDNFAKQTEEVWVAVAYATDASLLFEWCWKNDIPLKFYGRLDEDVAVSVPILEAFLSRKSANAICKLVQYHHAKVIWWRGVGVYVGSANLTDRAWNKNIEAGCYFDENEIDDTMANDLLALFAKLEEHATPLTEELIKEMKKRAKATVSPDAKEFWASPSFVTWPGLVQTTEKAASDKKRDAFLREWHATLQHLRDIGEKVSQPANRPIWINHNAPTGVQADQFLHAHYYYNTFDGRKANYEAHFGKNKNRTDAALAEAINWWRKLPESPNSEEFQMINVVAPKLRAELSRDQITKMSEDGLREICMEVHAIKDYARRVSNRSVHLPDNGTAYTIPEKVHALAHRLWTSHSASGAGIKELLEFVLYGGSAEQLPERLWNGVTNPKWKIDGFGISALGELVGWAMPDQFPPRNGRTSKALRSLGYDVTVHVT